MDCDDVCAYPMNLPVFESKLYRNDWDSLSFNRKKYYDIWALSLNPYYGSYFHFENGFNKMVSHINRRMRETNPRQLLRCVSAFNGLAIYRTKKFLNSEYVGILRYDLFPSWMYQRMVRACGKINTKNQKEDCEHRIFHLHAFLKNKARIRITPQILFQE
jgi:hypothetical protein